MLKKVRVDQLRPGMHLHELCGSWLNHPFWKKRFVLRDEADVTALRDSAVRECWIDIALGVDVDMPAAPSSPPRVVTEAPEAKTPGERPAVGLEEEMQRARALRERSRESVQTLFHDMRMGRALDAEACAPLVGDIVDSVTRNAGALTSLCRLKSHDDYTFMHSVAVCALMVSLGRKLGMDDADCREAGMAGLLHDIGKAAMPLDVLNKPGALTDSEFAVIRTHPERGRDMLLTSRGVGAIAVDVCAHHHERPDGQGYPDRLSGERLSRFARMGAICDVYDAITSNRAYKVGWDPAESVARMSEWTRNGQFDPQLFHAFVECMGIYPIGSLVRLQSGRLAVVVDQNPDDATAPTVRVFFSTRSAMSIPTALIDLASPRCSDRIVARESNARWGFSFLNELLAGADTTRARGARAPDRAAGGRA